MTHFIVSEADDLIKVGNVALSPNVVYPMGGNIVDKAYIETLPDELLANWRPFSVCGFLDFPPFFILNPTWHFFHGRDKAHCAFGVLSIFVRAAQSTHRTSF